MLVLFAGVPLEVWIRVVIEMGYSNNVTKAVR